MSSDGCKIVPDSRRATRHCFQGHKTLSQVAGAVPSLRTYFQFSFILHECFLHLRLVDVTLINLTLVDVRFVSSKIETLLVHTELLNIYVSGNLLTMDTTGKLPCAEFV